jgi:hypothetical protein
VQVKSGCATCDKATRRANHPQPVQTFTQKYSAFAVGQITDLSLRVSPDERGVAHVTNARVRCGGRESCDGRAWLMRTAKSCGPDAPVLASSLWIRSQATVARKPVTGESPKETVKPSRRESRDASAGPVCSCAHFLVHLHTRPRVQRAPGFPCALCSRRRERYANLGHFTPRDRGFTSLERSENWIQGSPPSLRGALATKQSIVSLFGTMDCFASLAMTVE